MRFKTNSQCPLCGNITMVNGVCMDGCSDPEIKLNIHPTLKLTIVVVSCAIFGAVMAGLTSPSPRCEPGTVNCVIEGGL